MQSTKGVKLRGIRSLTVFLLTVGLAGCAVLRRGDPPVDRSQDPSIQQALIARLQEEPAIDASRIRVEVDAGIVLLYGSVQGIGGWQCAIRNAELIPGVQSVVGGYLVIERGPREVRCLARRPH